MVSQATGCGLRFYRLVAALKQRVLWAPRMGLWTWSVSRIVMSHALSLLNNNAASRIRTNYGFRRSQSHRYSSRKLGRLDQIQEPDEPKACRRHCTTHYRRHKYGPSNTSTFAIYFYLFLQMLLITMFLWLTISLTLSRCSKVCALQVQHSAFQPLSSHEDYAG